MKFSTILKKKLPLFNFPLQCIVWGGKLFGDARRTYKKGYCYNLLRFQDLPIDLLSRNLVIFVLLHILTTKTSFPKWPSYPISIMPFGTNSQHFLLFWKKPLIIACPLKWGQGKNTKMAFGYGRHLQGPWHLVSHDEIKRVRPGDLPKNVCLLEAVWMKWFGGRPSTFNK